MTVQPLAALGFTSALTGFIAESLYKIDSYVDREKIKVDEIVAGHVDSVASVQRQIDDSIENLRSIQLERGYSKENQVSHKGLAVEKRELEDVTTGLATRKTKLQKELELRTQQTKGERGCAKG